jgi:hypothetical protein
MHAARILKLFSGVRDLLEYRKPPGFFDVGPGYALHPEPGSVTLDTHIRGQFATFVCNHPHSRTAPELVRDLQRYGDLKIWPERMVQPVYRVLRRQAPPELAGESVAPGDGLTWWTPVGIANVGRPDRARDEILRLSVLWKRPLEQDLLAAVQAGMAHALTPKATVDTLVEAACEATGPLARALIERAVGAARTVPRGDLTTLAKRVYESALVLSCPDTVDGELPPPAPMPRNTDEPSHSPLLAEQVPMAFAALVFGDGRSRITLSAAASLGRDASAVAATVGAWLGGLVGRSRLPREWVGAVVTANDAEIDLVEQGKDLADLVEPEIEL